MVRASTQFLWLMSIPREQPTQNKENCRLSLMSLFMRDNEKCKSLLKTKCIGVIHPEGLEI